MESVKNQLKARLLDQFSWVQKGSPGPQNVPTRLYVTQQLVDFGCKPHEILDHLKLPDEKSLFSEAFFQQIDILNIFQPEKHNQLQPAQTEKSIRRVLTSGIAGIGKTFTVQRFCLSWAEGKSNQHIDFIFVLPFRDLSVLREGEHSLLQLLLLFYPELTPLGDAQQLLNKRVLLVFDGLDESRFELDFDSSTKVSEINQKSTVDVLLTNMLKGNLLPDALLWVTSRPAAAAQIPPSVFDQMTEVHGFSEQSKEKFFSQKIRDVLPALRGMMSFHFLGHIPVCCRMMAELFEAEQKSRRVTTMTELYIYYLLMKTQKQEHKDSKKSERKPECAALLNLSQLALQQLQAGSVLFYEEDLRECGVHVEEAFCSDILQQASLLKQKKSFSFVHFSFQEFLAAVFVFHCCVTRNSSALTSFLGEEPAGQSLPELQKKVVDKALQSEKGQFDLFLCFFLGFCLKSNQMMLQDTLPQWGSSSDTAVEMKRYIRRLHAGNTPPERRLNLFLCMLELKEKRFQEEISRFMTPGARLSAIDCSVLSTVLLMTREVLEELDLAACYTPLVGPEKLMLQMKNCEKVVLKSEHLREDRLQALLSALKAADSLLGELSLVCFSNSNTNIPYDLFAMLGLNCKLHTLRLSGFTLSFEHCHLLASILQSKNSLLTVLELSDCIYSYPQDYSGYSTKGTKMTEKYNDVEDELSLLTTIPSAMIGSTCRLVAFSMSGCHLKSRCCQVFASVFSSNSQLRALDLSHNLLQDVGVQLLSVGLGSSKCRLEILRLSCCGITKEGCVFLASALKSNPSSLRELDLSYNHPGPAGVGLLTERLQDPKCRLEILNVDQNEEHWVDPQLLHRYACDLTFDVNTVNEHLLLSERHRKVSFAEEKQAYPDHPERFDEVEQVLCREALTGRCYWEVEWAGFVTIGVVCKSLNRKGRSDSEINYSSKSWCFNMMVWNGYSFRHGHWETFKPVPITDVQAFCTRRRRLGLFLDRPAGLLSLYSLSDDTKTLLHIFHASFTEPLHPAFSVSFSSSVTLSSVKKLESLQQSTASSFTPELLKKRSGVSYRFSFPGPGVFRCSVTGLVFNMAHEGKVTYKKLNWDHTVLQPARKVPGGPLFSIKCPQDSILQLHLPRCEPEPARLSEDLSVFHACEDRMSLIEPLKVTETHVVMDVPHL